MKSFLHTGGFPRDELEGLLRSAAEFKRGRRTDHPLKGKQIALVFFNPSLRTRTTFEVGIRQLGGASSTLEIGSGVWEMEVRDAVRMDGRAAEHVRDAARVLSRVFDMICVRAFPRMQSLEEDLRDPVLRSFAKHATVPVVNMESALYHPCQAMADLLTIREYFGDRRVKIVHAWTTHPRALPTSVSNSFVVAAAQMGYEVTLAHPPEFPLPEPVMRQAPGVRVEHDLDAALEGAHVVYGKSWGSPLYYGRWEEEAELRKKYADRRIDERRMDRTANGIYMHCMPLRRNVEVTDGVLESDRCAVYDQAENRLHVQKAILAELLG